MPGELQHYIDSVTKTRGKTHKGPSINYVVSVGGRGVDPKTIYYIDPTE